MTNRQNECFEPSAWSRMEFEGTPIYVRDCPPAWFVPNERGDEMLRRWLDGGAPAVDITESRFRERLPPGGHRAYRGRAASLGTPKPRELWLHLTDRCNMACRHCLFAASPGKGAEMPTETAIGRVGEAVTMGCMVFALTGGEPLMHPGIQPVVDAILAAPQTHVTVLTNGCFLRKHLDAIRRWGAERFHIQISIDGLPERHDRIRGTGAFKTLSKNLELLRRAGFPFTASMCVDADNVDDMPGVVEMAAEIGAANVHFMWLFVRGRAGAERFAPPERIFESLRRAAERSESLGLVIDNLAAAASQVFAPPGTIHDGVTAGWESAAIGVDGCLYPSAALIGTPELATPIETSLSEAWENGGIMEAVRQSSAKDMESPLRFLTGGGDLDHSYVHGRRFVGADPYLPLYERIALWLIARSAARVEESIPALRLKMGDILESCGAHGDVAMAHSNCLLSAAGINGRSTVKSYYAEAAIDTKEEILNPACYPDAMMEHIPPELRFRGYGCGSPVMDAALNPGHTVVDLGCGRGVECFLAARAVGAGGRVIGVDMLDPMLSLAKSGSLAVAAKLGYNNMEFRLGYLEDLPLDDDSADLMISNCVLNLSADKRRTFAEILRTLKPGGRLVVADIVTEITPDAAILNDEVLRGECIAGAFTHRDLVGILHETGFDHFRVIRRAPYRDVHGHRFFSLTYEARKPMAETMVRVMARGPMRAIVSQSGQVLFAGIPSLLPESEALGMEGLVAVFDDQGVAVNHDWQSGCTCALPSKLESASSVQHALSANADPVQILEKREAGCMVCGAPLAYRHEERAETCEYCGTTGFANAVCENGHYVCDTCHAAGALAVIGHLCRNTTETDMVELLRRIRRHPGIPVHGPEHHSLVPGIILATYRNLGGHLADAMFETALRRGGQVPGGSCAFVGICGAAAGVGIAFSQIIDANPLTPRERQKVMRAVNEVSAAVSCDPAARCCQRDAWFSLRKAAELSAVYLPVKLRAEGSLLCEQYRRNPDCATKSCPLWPEKR